MHAGARTGARRPTTAPATRDADQGDPGDRAGPRQADLLQRPGPDQRGPDALVHAATTTTCTSATASRATRSPPTTAEPACRGQAVVGVTATGAIMAAHGHRTSRRLVPAASTARQQLGARRRPGDPVGVRAGARGARHRHAQGALRAVHRRQARSRRPAAARSPSVDPATEEPLAEVARATPAGHRQGGPRRAPRAARSWGTARRARSAPSTCSGSRGSSRSGRASSRSSSRWTRASRSRSRATSTSRSRRATSGTTPAGPTSSTTRSPAASRSRSASPPRSSRGTSRC